MNDRDRISTRQLNRLRRRILRVYGTARREMQEQLTEFLAKYKALDEHKRAQALLFGVEGPDPDVVAANRELIAAAGGDPSAALAPKPPDPEDSPQQEKESQA